MTPIPPSHELPMESPVVVLSDLHLGHPATYLHDPAQLMPLMGPARTAIFNGDTFEQLNIKRRRGAERLMRRLIELCVDRGIRPFVLSGNHDTLASSAHYLDLFDGRVFLTHGDTLHESVAPWSREAPAVLAERRRLERTLPPWSVAGAELDIDDYLALTKKSELVAALYDRETPEGLAAQGYMVGKFAFKPWRIVLALSYWARVGHWAREFADRYRPNAKLFLFGHSHRPGVWMGRGLTVVNTGSFQPLSRPLVVHMDDRKAVVHRTKFRRHEYHLAEELHHVSLL